MEGTSGSASVIGYLSPLLPDSQFMLVDIGCSGGIDPVWRTFGTRLRALALDGNVMEIERLQRVEAHDGVRYLAALARLPDDHPFARKRNGRSFWGRNPWDRLSAKRSNDLLKAQQPRTPQAMTEAN